MSSARDSILGTIRKGLRGATAAALPALTSPREMPVGERVERFVAVLTKIGGQVDVVADHAALRVRIAAIVAASGAKVLALSDAEGLPAMLALVPTDVRRLPAGAPRDELMTADVGITGAQWGIAETGTLVLTSVDEQHRLASLLPAVHIAVLPRSRLLGTLGEAFALLQTKAGAPCARTITFVTGPSRTADIELTLVVGVHGPKSIHVLLLESD